MVKKINYTTTLRVLFILPGLAIFYFLTWVGNLTFFQMNYNEDWYITTYYYIRHVILFSGLCPLLVYLSWGLFGKKENISLGIVFIIGAIFLHYLVAGFSAHDEIEYFVMQSIEFLLLYLSYRNLRINKPKPTNTQ